LDSRGHIRVNDKLQTSAPGVWATGECAGSPQFTHVGEDDCRVVLDNLAGATGPHTGGLFRSSCSPIPGWATAALTGPERGATATSPASQQSTPVGKPDSPAVLDTLPAATGPHTAGLFRTACSPIRSWPTSA